MNHLAAIGFGYTAEALAGRLDKTEWRVTGSSRSHKDAADITRKGYQNIVWSNAVASTDALIAALHDVTHILISAPPTPAGDPIIEQLAMVRNELPQLQWIGYLSTVGVYGDHDGEWVDEDTPPNPTSERGRLRVLAEIAWQEFGKTSDITVQIFRLPGIYGPGRSAFDRLNAGNARRINRPGQVFNRMHVDDIAGAIEAAINTGRTASCVHNLVDDLPAPPQDVIAFAAMLMGIEPPPEISFDQAEMTAMARSFYGENKRVSNKRMRDELGYAPIYPTYREGLQAIWETSDR